MATIDEKSFLMDRFLLRGDDYPAKCLKCAYICSSGMILIDPQNKESCYHCLKQSTFQQIEMGEYIEVMIDTVLKTEKLID